MTYASAPAERGKQPRTAGRSTVEESPRDLLRSVWDEAAPELARVAAALGVPASRAEDVLQDVYVAASEKPPGGLDAAELRRWLFRVAINRCHLEHRRRARWLGALRGLTRLLGRRSEEKDATKVASEKEEAALVRRALEQLKPQMRSILVLRYFTGLDSGEIGRILQLPDSTARSHLRAAREKLALELRRAGYRDQ
jgi:RNA polymerase sigma factor (sigma-70 family)